MISKHWTSRIAGCLAGVAAVALGASVSLAEGDAPKLNVGGLSSGGGSVKGVVKFNGKQATRKPIEMTADKYCNTAHGDKPALDERFVFGSGDTLQNVFVYVSKGLEGKGPFKPEGKPEIDQIGCVYVPHVQGIVAGQEMLIINGDATLHNVKMSSQENGAFNDAMANKGGKLTKKFNKPEMGIPIKCDVHSWMATYVHVMPHPFFAVTQADGTFEIKGLPAGEYEVSTWHEFNKFTPDQKSYKVKIEDGKAAEVKVTYAPPAAK